MILRRRKQAYLDMFLQVLRTLEGLAAEVTLVRLQKHVNANVRSDVIALDRGRSARVPLTGQVEVVGALSTDVALANVVLMRISAT